MKQKGLTPIFILIGILLISGIVGGIYYLKIRKTESFEERLSRQNPVLFPSISPQQNNKPTPDIPQNDETANWKPFKMISTGFGYEIKLPPGWDSTPFTWGEGTQPLPEELAQNFFDKNCGINRGKVMILHFLSSNPQQEIKKAVNDLKKDGFTSSTIHTKTGINIEKLTGNLIGKTDYYAYFSSTKGYYNVSGRDECVANYGQTFDQILSTFRFLP